MTDIALLALLTEILAGAFAGALLVLFGHGAWSALEPRIYAARLARVRTALYDSELTTGEAWQARDALLTLPPHLRIRLLRELSRNLEGSARATLTWLAREAGIVRQAEQLVRSRYWWRRLKGARLLTLVNGDEILVLTLLRDPHPAVRAQAAEWAARHPTRGVAEALLEILKQPEAFCRFAAQDALLRLGPVAVVPLATFLERGEGPARVAALDVAIGMAQPAFSQGAIRLAGDEDPEIRARAVTLLGAIGSSDGVEPVQRRLDDPVGAVRAAAVRALGRLGHWPVAPAVAALLRDRSWDVRRAAGIALRDLGSPGILLLRRVRKDANLFAADMARQVLDLPDPAAARR